MSRLAAKTLDVDLVFIGEQDMDPRKLRKVLTIIYSELLGLRNFFLFPTQKPLKESPEGV